ncbi:calcium-binding protein [Paraconexibacter algicola]|uniref:calcium-binding protein n=1 Tax=Paraconexibacter algicola TaxID=2133960 RepID=UPI0018EE7D9E|nr:calcium-binding protein [Paraconexibacter algicola]
MGVPRIAFRARPLALLLAVAAAVPAAAAAAEPVGQPTLVAVPGAGGQPCPGADATACTVALVRDAAGRPAGMPRDGVLVAIRLRAAAGTTDELQVRVLRPDGAGLLRPVAAAPARALDGGTGVQRWPVRLAVREGDLLAVRGATLPPVAVASAVTGAAAVVAEPPAWPVGAASRAPDAAAGSPGDLQLAGDLEPDADGDAHGDLTQDDCPADPARVGACAIDLVASASAPTYAVAGRPLTHVYVVRNRGASPADAAVLDLESVEGATPTAVDAPGACAPTADVVTRCALGRLAPGDAVRVTVTLSGPVDAVARTQARASARGTELVAGDESAAAQTRLTAESVAPAARPFTVAPCANVQTGTGDDEVLNGTGFGDRLIGRAGRDLLRGGDGPDCLEGGPGSDVLDGGTGDDRLAGAAGNDRLEGGPGADTLRGGLGRDRLLGGAGADLLLPGPGVDRVEAGDGDDRVDARDRTAETVDCGRGSDQARVDRRDRVRGCERVARG